MTKRIVLIRQAGVWMARHLDNLEIVALFGTDLIPTPFTSQASFETVKARLAKLNPGCDIQEGD